MDKSLYDPNVMKLYSDEVQLFFARNETEFLDLLSAHYGTVEGHECFSPMVADDQLYTRYQFAKDAVPETATISHVLPAMWKHDAEVAVTASLLDWSKLIGVGFFCCTEI